MGYPTKPPPNQHKPQQKTGLNVGERLQPLLLLPTPSPSSAPPAQAAAGAAPGKNDASEESESGQPTPALSSLVGPGPAAHPPPLPPLAWPLYVDPAARLEERYECLPCR